MFNLDAVTAFQVLDPPDRATLARAFELRYLPSGQVVCRRGERGRALYVVQSGGVAIELGADSKAGLPRIHLGPGQLFGEMALLSGQPVSATVSTVRDTWLGVLEKRDFDALIERHPRVLASFLELLAARLRHRTTSLVHRPGGEIILAVAADDLPIDPFARAIGMAVASYAPGSVMLVCDQPAPHAAPSAKWPRGIGPPIPNARPCSEQMGLVAWSIGEEGSGCDDAIHGWRLAGEAGRFLVVVLRPPIASRLSLLLTLGDAVLLPLDIEHRYRGQDSGLADRGWYRIAWSREPLDNDPPWYHLLRLPANSTSGIDRRPDDEPSSRPAVQASTAPANDDAARLARWLTRRCVGIAMGAGAALGLAHLGVLLALDEEGVPIDFLCGTSMGGAVALAYARYGSAAQAADAARAHIGSNRSVLDPTPLPRSAMLRGAKVHRATERMFGRRTLDQFSRPCAVVAADLVQRDRHVIASGEAALAARSTAAIPGLFPPVRHEGRLLVDGALINRIPVDLLAQQRCGLRLAVNVIPSRRQRHAESRQREAELVERVSAVFGARHVIAESWELLGWWHGAADAQSADVLIEPATEGSGFDFSSIDRMIEFGRRAARENMPEILKLSQVLFRPGVP